jgi:hypothetical protein
MGLLLFAALGPACRARSERGDIARRFDVLTQVDQATALLPAVIRAAAMGALYQELFASSDPKRRLDRVADKDLELLYRAASLVEYDTLDAKYLPDMQSYLDALQRRNVASHREMVRMYQALVSARKLAEAGELARHHPHPEMPALPALRDASGTAGGLPTELVLDLDRHELVRRSVDLHQAALIVVVGHPSCHFTQNAVRAIQADSVLGEVFRAHAVWLAPQESAFGWDQLEQWNRSHPGQELAIAFRRDEWPAIDTWNLPTFYFFKDGALRAKFFGWPEQGRWAELRSALRQIGLTS